jgi:hypothetical protein
MRLANASGHAQMPTAIWSLNVSWQPLRICALHWLMHLLALRAFFFESGAAIEQLP